MPFYHGRADGKITRTEKPVIIDRGGEAFSIPIPGDTPLIVINCVSEEAAQKFLDAYRQDLILNQLKELLAN